MEHINRGKYERNAIAAAYEKELQSMFGVCREPLPPKMAELLLRLEALEEEGGH